MYQVKDPLGEEGEFPHVVSGAFSWFLYYVAIVYLSIGFVSSEDIPRLIIFFTLLLSIIGVGIFRYFFGKLHSFLLSIGTLPKQRILIFAKADNEVLEEIRGNPAYEIVKIVSEKEDIEEIFSLIREHKIDEILSLDSGLDASILEECFALARIYGVLYRYADSFLFSEPFKTNISFLSGVPVVEIVSIGLTPWGRIVKRTFDIFVSAVLLVILLPFL